MVTELDTTALLSPESLVLMLGLSLVLIGSGALIAAWRLRASHRRMPAAVIEDPTAQTRPAQGQRGTDLPPGPNVDLGVEPVRARIAEAIAQGRSNGAIVILNLDNFRLVNDGYGHPVGDAILQAVFHRIRRTLRDRDTVGRIGADEFLIFLDGVGSAAIAAEIGERLRASLRQPFSINGETVRSTASLGVALLGRHGGQLDDLIRQATNAMSAAKRRGGDSVEIPTSPDRNDASERLRLENDLRTALERDEFELFYQPKYDMAGTRMVGAEALLRWRHPTRGLVSPTEFIGLAEDTGLIVPIGDWVLREALAARSRWHNEKKVGELPTVAVNISFRQFERPGFYEVVRDAIDHSGCQPYELELELTETILMMNAESSIEAMNKLRALGVGLSVDDFGTGYSSLSLLKRVPLSIVKIDRSFVSDLPTSREDSAITNAIISLARTLGFQTVAEGVETEEQRIYLMNAGCSAMQGYLMAPPLPEHEFLSLLRVQGSLASDRTANRDRSRLAAE